MRTEPFSALLQVRVSERLYAAVEASAKSQGMRPPEFVRRALTRAVAIRQAIDAAQYAAQGEERVS